MIMLLYGDYRIYYDKGRYKLVKYKDRFDGLFKSETGEVTYLDSYRECIEYIKEEQRRDKND